MGKNIKKMKYKKNLPLLPPDLKEDEVQLSEEDVEFLHQNKPYTAFLNRLDTRTITKQVVGLQDGDEEDALEFYYEKRLIIQKQKEKDNPNDISNINISRRGSQLEVDPANVLPVKTLSGQLYFKIDSRISGPVQENNEGTLVDSNVNEDISGAKGSKNLSKAERRKELKKAKRQAKEQGKEESKGAKLSKAPESVVLEELKKDLFLEELFAQRKLRIAEIGVGLLADPEKNISVLKELVDMCSDDDKNISRLALLSAMAVFKDIVPGYRVRLPTEKELQIKVSKEVKQLRDYESNLLRCYQTYLQKLITLGNVSSSHQIAVRCMCGLLEAIPHFNYRDSLLAAVIPHLSAVNHINRRLAVAAVRSLFLSEGKHGGDATVEAVELIADFVKRHQCRVHPDTVEVFLTLSFNEDLGRIGESQMDGNKHCRWKQKNVDLKTTRLEKSENKVKKRQLAAKLREEVEADFRAASSAPDALEHRRMQSQALAAVFKTYFRILKCSMELQRDRSYNPPAGELLDIGVGPHPLLVPCLDGLGKFSHLINVDFMGDLLGFLKNLAASKNTTENINVTPVDLELTVSERLRCCIVAFKIVRSNLDALNIDLQEFFVQLYNILLDCEPERENQGQELGEALQIMLCEIRQHDMQRAAGFTKRLASLSLYFGSAGAMMVLVTLKMLLQNYSKCRNLLENDGGGGSVGGTVARYQPEVLEPELSGALASILWELALLAKHYHPSVSQLANSIASMNISQNQVFLSTLSPQEALHTYSLKEGLFLPTVRKPNPNHKRKRNDSSKKLVVNPADDQIKAVEDKDLVRRKFTMHFKVLKDIKENEKLRKELNTTLSSLRLYDEYKAKTSTKSRGAKSPRF